MRMASFCPDIMNSPQHHCHSHTKCCTGPVPSHKHDAVVVIDFTTSANMPRFVEDICGKETVLDTETSSFLPSPVKSSYHVETKKEEDSSGFLSFSKTSEGLELDEMDSSQRKLMSTVDMSSSNEDNEAYSMSHDGNCWNDFSCITYPVAFLSKYKKIIHRVLCCLLFIGITTYLVVAMILNPHRALPLLVVYCLVLIYKICAFFRKRLTCRCYRCLQPVAQFANSHTLFVKCVLIVSLLLGFGAWIGCDTLRRPHQLISGVGYITILFCLFVTSKYPGKVVWRPVIWGLLIQITFGMVILRTRAGFVTFHWLGKLAQTFIDYVDEGAKFVFGDTFKDHFFAFKVLPIVLYFSSFISIMYYLGAMQWLILKLSWLMQISLNTSATESLVAAGNIFVGQTESPLLIRPYIHDLTLSEMHAVMTAGFGTIAGSVLGAYLGYGIQPVYVITACVMAAPCALAVSKLFYPETKTSKFTSRDGLVLEKSDQRNLIEAAFVGASQAIPLVVNIAANLIAFLALLAAVNGFLAWFGGLVNFPQLSFQVVCSYVFMPIAYLTGVEWQDCFKVAELIGVKIFLNEFIAYKSLAGMIETRDNGTIPRNDPVTGDVYWIDERSEAIVTYALCGFANIGSLGIMLGGLGSMAPTRQGEMAKIVLRALVAGIFVSILNACVAGFLYIPRPIVCGNMMSTTSNWTFTEPARLHECCSTALMNVVSVNTTATACHCCSFFNQSSSFYLNCSSLGC